MNKKIINILLADDDEDDRYFFAKALEDLPVLTNLKTVDDGEQLINYLSKNSGQLPDILFLDLNMPRKNGSECLAEIKSNKNVKNFPVVIYSTSLNSSTADLLYQKGAHSYLRKCDLPELEVHLQNILTNFEENDFGQQPSKDKFILKLQEV